VVSPCVCKEMKSLEEKNREKSWAHLEPPSASKPQNSMMTCTWSSELLLPRVRMAVNAAFSGSMASSFSRAPPY
jgi:hypothetical protein